MDDIIEYIKSFLLYGDTTMTQHIGYTADESLWSRYKVVIVPCGYLGSDLVLPDMDHPIVEQTGKTFVVRTDLIYNTFFFISRAEELINSQRDEHGRFAARFSILGQGNNLEIPLVDEYARILMKLLDMPLPQPRYAHIYLTHDVDILDYYRHLRGALGGIRRGHIRDVFSSLTDIHRDHAYTFPWMVEQDAKVPTADTVYFVKHTTGKGFDYPQYNTNGHDFNRLASMLSRSGAKLGLHSSYYGLPDDGKQADYFRTILAPACPLHRSHYLRCSIDNMQRLADLGFTDDFSMAFPDRAGFRLQTTRPVRWINPKTLTLTALTLHPLTLMDCTLSNANYMNLSEDEAYFFSEQLLDRVRHHAGDVTLLWHNNRFFDGSYHETLYPKLLKGLRHYSHHND